MNLRRTLILSLLSSLPYSFPTVMDLTPCREDFVDEIFVGWFLGSQGRQGIFIAYISIPWMVTGVSISKGLMQSA